MGFEGGHLAKRTGPGQEQKPSEYGKVAVRVNCPPCPRALGLVTPGEWGGAGVFGEMVSQC